MKKQILPQISEQIAAPLAAIASPQRIAILLAIGTGEACVWSPRNRARLAAGLHFPTSDGAPQSGYFAGQTRGPLHFPPIKKRVFP